MPLRRTSRSSSPGPPVDLDFDSASPLDDSVSTLRTSARILADVAGVLTKFPFVKPLAAVTVVVCEIFENVKSNDVGWDGLAKQAVSLIVAIVEKQQDDPIHSVSSLSAHCNLLLVKLEAVRAQLRKKSNRHWIKKVLRNSIDKDMQAEFKRFLDHACLIFQIQTLMDINMRTVAVQVTVMQLNDKLMSCEEKLERVQASAIKLGERQLLDRLSNISGVQYNPGNTCASGTRLGILCEIETWASDISPPFVASLRGKAGIGKTTVAHTVAVNCFNTGCLAASYFFSRDVAMSRPLKNLLPQLSRQIAFRIPSFRHALCSALESDDFPVFPRQQLSKLFIEPLRTSLPDTRTRPWIVILDALDECEDDIRDCILHLTEAISEFQGRLKLIVTSRPEAAIDAVQRLRQTHVLNIDITGVDNESDLRIYFELRLRPLRVQPGWPTIDPIQKFVVLAGGLFVWAAIVTEFLLESDTLSEEIELILNGTRWEDNPEKRLAQMYYIILDKAYLSGTREVHFRLFLPVLATVMVVREPQSDVVIGHLAADDVRYEHLRRILEGLSAALHIPPDGTVVRATHPSFYRYLSEDCKDNRFAVHSATHSRRLGQRCLTIIFQKVHRDMCGIMGHAESHVVDFRHDFSERIPEEVQYACRNWIFHIVAHPDILIDSQTVKLLSEFFQSQLLPWIEVMALLAALDVARESLGSLNHWLEKCNLPDQILVESTTDALMFLREFNHIIAKNPTQVHVSALHFSPRSSTIWKNYIELPNQSTLVKCGAETCWPSTQMFLRSTLCRRECVSFSPDGRLLAESDRSDITGQTTVQIWDLEGFFTIYTSKFLLCSQSTLPELVFTPDSETLLLKHGAVYVFNFLQKYEPDIYKFPNNIEVWAAIAPDGSAFAIGSPENAIEIWQVKPRKLNGRIGHGRPCSLSGGGTKLLYLLPNLSGPYSNQRLKCWHADTGRVVDIPDSQSNEQVLSVDGMLVLLISKESVSMHNSDTGSLLFQKHFHRPFMDLRDVILSPDATHLAVVVEDPGGMGIFFIHIIDVKLGRLKAVHSGMDTLAWSPSSTMLAFLDPDDGIFLWEQATNGDMVLTFSGHKLEFVASSLAISPDGRILVPVRKDGDIPLLTLTSHTKSDTPQLRFSMDGPDFIDKNSETTLLGVPKGRSPLDVAVDSVSTTRRMVTAFEISSNGRLIATLSELGLITIYDAHTGEQEGTCRTRLTNANRIQFASDGNFIAVTFKPTTGNFTSSSQSGNRQSEVWNTTSRTTVYHSNDYQILQFYPNGHNLVCASSRKARHVNTLDIDTVKNRRGSEVPLSEDSVRIHTTLAFAIQSGVHRLAGIDLDSGFVHVWDIKRLVSPAQLDIPQCYEGAPLTELAFSADGRILAAASVNCILIWTLIAPDSGSVSATLVGHEFFGHLPQAGHYPSFSPNGQMLAYTANHTRKLWDTHQLHPPVIDHSPLDHLWNCQREWRGDHHYCILMHDRISFYRARDMTGFPEVVEDSEHLRCINANGRTGLFSQPGLELHVPSYKLPVSPMLLRLNELQSTVSFYWVQKDGRLVSLELPAP